MSGRALLPDRSHCFCCTFIYYESTEKLLEASLTLFLYLLNYTKVSLFFFQLVFNFHYLVLCFFYNFLGFLR